MDVTRHSSDREVRDTVLHEMIHAVLDRDGHGMPYWTQLEYLRLRRAPITPGFPELGERGSHLAIIPSRFRRCRRLFRPIYERWQRDITRPPGPDERLTPKDIERHCEDGATGDAVADEMGRSLPGPMGSSAWMALDPRCVGPGPGADGHSGAADGARSSCGRSLAVR